MSGEFNKEHGEFLLRIARETINKKFYSDFEQNKQNAKEDYHNVFTKIKMGVFVTIEKNHQLRGCIGIIEPSAPVLETVEEYSINAAFKDPRFPPVEYNEIDSLKLEISLLSKPEKIEYKSVEELFKKIKPFHHGVIIKKKFYKATFLPQVWEQLPEKKRFFSHLCTKAGLPSNEWEKGKLSVKTYNVQYFKEE